MKMILSLLCLALASFSSSAQTKHRYFYYACEFTTDDGCKHNTYETFTNIKGLALSFDGMWENMKKYAAPQKIIKKTFKITEYRQVNYKEFISYKSNKFQTCKSKPGTSFSTISAGTCDSCLFIATPVTTNWLTHGLIAFDGNNEFLHISSPDSTQTYTVQFSKSHVQFINDSTFTFKLK